MSSAAIKEGTLLWEPSEKMKSEAQLTEYMAWLNREKGLRFNNYQDLWEWSVTRVGDFWESVWKYFDIQASRPYERVLEGVMPSARWFQGAELNYAEHAFRRMTSERPALMFQSETQPLTTVSWEELRESVASVAAVLRQLGVQKGDRVVAYLPNIPQTIIAFLAVAGIGAIWSSCSPDFGTRSVVDRFRQIDPKVLFAVDGYNYGGTAFSRIDAVKQIQDALPSLKKTVLVPYLKTGGENETPPGLRDIIIWDDVLAERAELAFEQVPFDHPLWVVYSSGTTGLPKGLVHGHGGVLLEFLKFKGLN
ncbi:MAG: AMP-binding protein, partial [Deltaproteobacteria bacterium]|nr:AMP-binding protein [Deltaproteobacteria bacterium]